MNRFFVEKTMIQDGSVLLDGAYAHQIVHVLRLKAGDQVEVLDNSGLACRVELTEVLTGRVSGRILDRAPCPTEPKVRITLFQAMLKRDKFEWVLQKGTEVGMARIVPVVTSRTLVQKTEAKAGKLDRWRTILREAAEQSGRGRIPELSEPIPFREALAGGPALGLMASTEPQTRPIDQVLTGRTGTIGLFIGPEGGFDPQETAMAKEAGIACISLGKRILRTETAAVVALTLTLNACGDL